MTDEKDHGTSLVMWIVVLGFAAYGMYAGYHNIMESLPTAGSEEIEIEETVKSRFVRVRLEPGLVCWVLTKSSDSFPQKIEPISFECRNES